MKSLIAKWRMDAEQYQRQVDEARLKGTPHAGMLATAGTLRSCALDLEKLLAASAPDAPPHDDPPNPGTRS